MINNQDNQKLNTNISNHKSNSQADINYQKLDSNRNHKGIDYNSI